MDRFQKVISKDGEGMGVLHEARANFSPAVPVCSVSNLHPLARYTYLLQPGDLFLAFVPTEIKYLKPSME